MRPGIYRRSPASATCTSRACRWCSRSASGLRLRLFVYILLLLPFRPYLVLISFPCCWPPPTYIPTVEPSFDLSVLGREPAHHKSNLKCRHSDRGPRARFTCEKPFRPVPLPFLPLRQAIRR